MKNIFYFIILFCTTNAFSQSNITTDDTFLKYEKAYNDYVNATSIVDLKNLDILEKEFYSNFKNIKSIKNYLGSKDKRRWLEKNVTKTSFANLNDALAKFDIINNLRTKQIEDSALFTGYLNDLLKKYDADLIWQTLKSRALK